MSENWDIENSKNLYNVHRWSDGHFAINQKGNLCVLPKKTFQGPVIDMMDVYEEMKSNNVQLPAVIRFQDILRGRILRLNRAFREIIDEEDYQGRYFGVYPIKVNQLREVVEEVVDAGKKYNYGLEAGSKAELVVALAMNSNRHSLTVLNGHKDEQYLRLAFLGHKIGRNVIIVIEKFSELQKYIALAKEYGEAPEVGMRARLTTKGKGKWAESGGENAKFGLTSSEIVMGVKLLEQNSLIDKFKLLHFHIGSQITDIATIKDALTEAARYFCKLKKMGAPIEYFDAGGGVGVDYEGSKSQSQSSINYDLEDYIRDIVYTLKQTCDSEDVNHPNIVTETGRAMTAHHSCVITNVFGTIQKLNEDFPTGRKTGEHQLLTNIREVLDNFTVERIQESYNDAKNIKLEAGSAFKLGILELEEKAKIETLYWKIAQKILDNLDRLEYIPDQLQKIESELSFQYLCNFSVFQSTPDAWAIGQLLPIVPISRHQEKPTIKATIADLTCDSDGKIDCFMSGNHQTNTLSVHKIKPGDDYPIGIFLTGAYQDIMGDMHNLFGRLNEVHVYTDDEDPDDFYIEEVIHGNTNADVLSTLQYSPVALASMMKKEIDKQILRGKLRPKDGIKLIDFYEKCLHSYTYLDKF